MSDLKTILEKTYLTKLRIEMHDYYKVWKQEEYESPHIHLVKLEDKLKDLVCLKYDEISSDIDSYKPHHKRELINKLRKEIDNYNAQNNGKGYDEYSKIESRQINACKSSA